MLRRSDTAGGDPSSVSDRLNALLRDLRLHILGRHFMIAGPLVRGEAEPARLDVVADLREEAFRPARVPDFQTLLALSHPFFGSPDLLHPYLMFRDRLLERCRNGNYWVECPEADGRCAALVAEMLPVRAVAPVPARIDAASPSSALH
jgi:hypothetical protein